MRNARDSKLLFNRSGIPAVLMLGAGYHGEQECGIRPLEEALGVTPINKDHVGLEARIQTQLVTDKIVTLLEAKETPTFRAITVLIFSTGFYRELPDARTLTRGEFYRDLYFPLKKYTELRSSISAAWGEKDFGVITSDPDCATFLRDFHKALTVTKDAAFWVSAPDRPFGRGGLALAIASRIDQVDKDEMLAADLEWLQANPSK